MAFTEISRQTGTVIRVTSTTATDTKNLSAAPVAGQWLVVALYTNQGTIPAFGGTGANNLVNSVTCGSIALSLLESGLNTSVFAPTVYLAPYQSGMTTAINVNWTNGVAATTLGLAAIVFTGPLTGATSGYSQFRTTGINGAFDSSGADYLGFGFTQAVASSGIITWAQSASGILTNYDTQGQVFIAALTSTSSFNANQSRQFGFFGAAVDGSGNLTTLGQATGTAVINNATSVVTSGKGVIYSPSGNFVFTYTGTNTATNTLTGCTTTAPSSASIPGYCQLMLANNGTSTITAVLPTNSLTSGTLGGFQTGNSTAYSGVSTANGHVQVTISPGGTPCRLDLMLGSNVAGTTSVKAYANMKISGSNVPVGGGFIYTMVPLTRTMTRTLATPIRIGRALLMRVFTVNRAAKTTSIRLTRLLRVFTVSRAAKTTSIRLTRLLRVFTVSRAANSLSLPFSLATRVATYRRLSRAATGNLATITRRQSFNRLGTVQITYSISTSRFKTLIRRTMATTVGLAKVLGVKVVQLTNAGTVEVGFIVPTVGTGFVTASAEGGFLTATVGTDVIFKVKG